MVNPTAYALTGGSTDPEGASGGYMFIDSTEPGGPMYAWDEIRDSGVLLTETGDDGTIPVGDPLSIGFNFPFFDKTFTQFKLNPNGTVFLDADNGYSSSQYRLQCFERDMITDAQSNIYYKTNDAQNELVIEYDQVKAY